jgi:hypothetical protein
MFYIYDAATEKFLALKFQKGKLPLAVWHHWDNKLIIEKKLYIFDFEDDLIEASIERTVVRISQDYYDFGDLMKERLDSIYIVPCRDDVPDFTQAYR